MVRSSMLVDDATLPDPAPQQDVPLSQDVRKARPPGDDLARDRARAKLSHSLFGEPEQATRLGRFVLLERLGQGGMGVVYSAYDPELDRRVALKLLRPNTKDEAQREHARARLKREAQALARLSHPNVVPVHDVGLIDERVFIVMEMVAGQTLEAWVETKTRSWREILAAYRQAGSGLAAAHRLGVIHRDFKPSNVLVGEDDRVRVVDFGLARGITEVESTLEPAAGKDDRLQSGRSPALEDPITQTGAVMGTPAYMAPEQVDAAQVDAAADQFSFCASLYEALYRQRPFSGETMAARQLEIEEGRIREPPRGSGVPRWIHAALCRGLKARPKDRHPSMAALLTLLGRDPARTRRRLLVGTAFGSVVGIAIYAFATQAPPRTAADLCQVASDELAPLWSDERRAAVAQAFSTAELPYAAQAGPRVLATLAAYAKAWGQMREQACVAYQRGGDSSDVYDRRVTCLSRRRHALDHSIVQVIETAAASPERTIDIVRALPPLNDCSDAARLRSGIPSPPEAIADAVEHQRQRLDEAQTLWAAGKGTAAYTRAEQAVDEAQALDYLPLQAEALLTLGRTAMKTNEHYLDSAPILLSAMLEGLHTGQDEIATEAAARYIYVIGTSSLGRSTTDDRQFTPDLALLMQIAKSQAERAPEHRAARALLYNNLASAQLAAQHVEIARRYYQRALDQLADIPGAPPELDHIFGNLAHISPDEAERERLFARAFDRFDAAYGPEHPETLGIRLDYAYFVADPALAHDHLAPVCETYERYHPQRVADRHRCWFRLAFLTAERGERSEAARIFDRLAADDDPVGELATQRQAQRELARGLAHELRGELEPAIAPLTWVTTVIPTDLPWDAFVHGQAVLGLGKVRHQQGQHHAAVAHLERALEIFEDYCAQDVTQNVKGPQWRAAAQVALAAALVDANADGRARALELVERSAEFYRQAGEGYRWRLDALERWRRENTR
ncbi:MAG: serine/threonine-protein kinase [Myxococcota bacterium]